MGAVGTYVKGLHKQLYKLNPNVAATMIVNDRDFLDFKIPT